MDSSKILTGLGLILLIVFLCGCGDSRTQPVLPGAESLNDYPVITDNSKSTGTADTVHGILGAYDLVLNDDGTFELTELRTADMHVNVTQMLFPPKCIDCFIAELMEVIGEFWTFKFTIHNPTMLTGYDTRVTVTEQGDIRIMNPSSYTYVFAPPSDTEPNPFVVFDSGNGQNMWGPGTTADVLVTLQKPAGAVFSTVKFVVDASYPGNQEDPYKIADMLAQPGSIHIDGVDSTNIIATVRDWQDNINYVTIDLSPLGGSGTAEMTKAFGNLWVIEGIHYLTGGDGPGIYDLRITAGSTGFETYNYVKVNVIDGPTTPAVELLTPNGGEKWIAGSNHEITWETFDIAGNVDLEYSKDNFQSDTHVIVEDIMNAGLYMWTNIPEDYSDTVRVRVSSTATSWKADVSDSDFSIVDPSTIGWAVTWGDNGKDVATEMAIGPDGNPVTTGYIGAGGLGNAYIAKFDASGQSIFELVWGSAADDLGIDVCVDSIGQITAVGNFHDTVDFDPGPGEFLMDSPDGWGGYVSQFDANGNFLNAFHVGQGIYGVEVDQTGNIYVTGNFFNTWDFDPGPGEYLLTSNGDQDAFVACYDSNLVFLWAKSWGNAAADNCWALDINDAGNVVVCGKYIGTVDFDPGPGFNNRTSVSDLDAFVSMFDTGGNYQWTLTWGGTGYDSAYSIALDSSGNSYLTGRFEGTGTDFDPGPGTDYHSTNGLWDVYLVSYAPTGDLRWANTWGGTENDHGFRVTVDADNVLYVGGEYKGSNVDFDPGAGSDTHSAVGNVDAFLSKFDTDGLYQWVRVWGGLNEDEAFRASVDQSGNIFVCGYQEAATEFAQTGEPCFDASDIHYSNGIRDSFLMKFLPDGCW